MRVCGGAIEADGMAVYAWETRAYLSGSVLGLKAAFSLLAQIDRHPTENCSKTEHRDTPGKRDGYEYSSVGDLK